MQGFGESPGPVSRGSCVWGDLADGQHPADAAAAPPPACGCDLAEGGFFVRQGEYICTRDYQRLYGTRCFSCDQFIEGEVVSALGKTYHPDCFVCAACR